MKSHRISTTISEKHWVLLHKLVEKYQTQQKTLEVALESLENSSKQSNETLTREQKAWMQIKKQNTVCVIDKNAFKLLVENANLESLKEYFIKNKFIEARVELIIQRPISELNLEELIIGIVSACQLINWIDVTESTENDIYYSLVMSHSLGQEISKMISESYRNMFITYGIMAEITTSAKTIFIKIFK